MYCSNIVFNTHVHHLKEDTRSPEDIDIMKKSLLHIYNTFNGDECRWRQLLNYFNEHLDDVWTSDDKTDVCRGHTRLDTSVLNKEKIFIKI